MKKTLLYFVLFSSTFCFSQRKLGRPMLTGSGSFVLGINENYTPFNSDDDETLLIPTGIFFRLGFGYEFKRRVAILFNSGFDYHWNYAVSAFPTYGSLRFNITEVDEDALFLETSYGKMWRPSSKYPDGNYYGFGVGLQIAGEYRWNGIIRLDFHRKAIFGFENNRIDSIAIGFGFSFF